LGNVANLRLAGIVDESIVDGPGVRFTIFTQGCHRACPGCHNPETQSFSGGFEIGIDEILQMIDRNPLLAGVTFSGGEPFLQASPLAELAIECHARQLSVMAYSGYRFEELLDGSRADWRDLLGQIDILVDGPYMESERSLALRFRGSRNQRIIAVPESLRNGTVVLVPELN